MSHSAVVLLSVAPLVFALIACDAQGDKANRETAPSRVLADANGADPRPPRGRWVNAREGALREYATASGSFHAPRTTRLGTQVSGRVTEVLVDVGGRVSARDAVVKLDSTLLAIEVEQREAALHVAESARAKAKLDLERMRNLWERPAGAEPSIPRKRLDDAQAVLDAAAARVTMVEKDVKHARQRLAECVITAPFSGVVTARYVDPGEPVTAAPITHLIEIQEVDTLELEFSLPQAMLSVVRARDGSRRQAGTVITFEVDGVAEKDTESEIAVIFPALDPASRSFRCRALVDNASGAYRPNMFAAVRVVVREGARGLVVPGAAVFDDEQGAFLFTDNEGQPILRRVTLGESLADEVLVVDGLQAGDRVLLPTSGQ